MDLCESMNQSTSQPPNARRRVLLIAYACSPESGSEPAVGWNRALASAKDFDTWVICLGIFEPAIRRFEQLHGAIPGLRFVPVHKSWFARLLRKIPGLYYLSYKLWHRRALRVASELHDQVGLDLIHQVSLCGYREPGSYWRLPVPCVWGPWGGTQNFPWRFLAETGFVGGASELIRSLANWVQLRFSPSVRRAARHAIPVAGNSENQRAFERIHGVRTNLLPGNGIATIPRETEAAHTQRVNAALRILWVGRLEHFKGLSLLLHAIAQLPESLRIELHVVGSGAMHKKWARLAQKLRVDNRVSWRGALSYQETLHEYLSADVFVCTTLRDTLPTVVLEALAAGLPVVCLDHCGMNDVVTDACGIRVPVTWPSQVATNLAQALTTLAGDPALRARLSSGATVRARTFLWEQQRTQISALYQQLMESLPEGYAPDSSSQEKRPEWGQSSPTWLKADS